MSFLDLPVEIRINIYELSLTDLTREPPCPCTKTPNHRFATYWALSLVSKQVYWDITSLFRKKYRDQVYLYFDDIVPLHDFYQYANNRGDLKELNFCLRFSGGYISGDAEYRYTTVNELREDASIRLCHSEPGCPELWEMFEAAYDRMHSSYPRSRRIGCHLMSIYSCGLSGFDINATYSGMCKSEGGHALPCQTLSFPKTERGLQFSMHEGLDIVKELRGRLSDLSFQGVDMDLLKSGLYQRRDSAWRWNDCGSPWCFRTSPDLESEERRDMDDDSWGVPDRGSTEAEAEGDWDSIEYRWQANFGDETE